MLFEAIFSGILMDTSRINSSSLVFIFICYI